MGNSISRRSHTSEQHYEIQTPGSHPAPRPHTERGSRRTRGTHDLGRAPALNQQARARTDRAMRPPRGLPDLSGIDYVHEDIAVPRLKSVLQHFIHARFTTMEYAEQHGMSTEVGGGVCLATAVEWIEFRLAHPVGGVFGPGQHLAQASTLETIVATQREFEHETARIKQTQTVSPEAANAEAALLTARSRGFACMPVMSSSVDAERLAEQSQNPGNYLVSLAGFNHGHALAVRCPQPEERSRHVVVFDPNAGEFRVEKRHLVYFFEALLARYRTVGWRYAAMNVLSLSPGQTTAVPSFAIRG